MAHNARRFLSAASERGLQPLFGRPAVSCNFRGTASAAMENGSSSMQKLPKHHCEFQERQLLSSSEPAPEKKPGVKFVGASETESFNEGSFNEESMARRRVSVEDSSFMVNGMLRKRSSMLTSQHTVNNLLTFIGGDSGAKRDQDFSHDVERTRKRLRDISRRTIDPRSRFVRIWDAITVLALAFTAFVTPFEVGFFEEGGTIEDAPITFTLNRIIDAVFAMDVCFAFFLPYRAPLKEGGMMIYDNKRIAKAYLKGWFFLDVFTCIPFDMIFAAIVEATRLDVDPQSFRLLRMLRLAKLLRIIRASRIINRWQDHVGLSFALLALVKFTIMTCVLAHWLACLWGFVGVSEAEEWTSHDNAHQNGGTWRQKSGIGTDGLASPYKLYGVCLYVALNNIFGGSCEINPANYTEFYVQGAMLFVGSSMWAYIIGSACGIIATLDPARIEFRQTMDEINYFVSDQSLSDDLAVKLRAYFRNTIHYVRSRRYDRLLQKMSTRLRGDAAFEMCRLKMRKVPYLVHPELEPEFMCNLSIKYATTVYSRLERVPCTNLFVVERGVVAKRGRLGLVGSCFGMDLILSNDNLRDIGDAIALTFVQTISLTQDDIFSLLPEYPKAYVIVRKAALRMALVRALVKASNLVKTQKMNLNGISIAQIFDQAMSDAAEARTKEIEDRKPNRAHIPLSLGGGSLEERAAAAIKRIQQRHAKTPMEFANNRWSNLMAKRKKAVDGSAFNAKKSQEPFKQSPSVEGFKGGGSAQFKLLGSSSAVSGADNSVEQRLSSLESSLERAQATMLARMAKLEEALLARLDKGSDAFDFAVRSRRRLSRIGSMGAKPLSPGIVPVVASPNAKASYRAEVREEGAHAVTRSSPWDA